MAVSQSQSTTKPNVIQQNTKFPPDDPALVRQAFATDLFLGASFASGMNQFDAIAIDDPKQRRLGLKGVGQILIGIQPAEESDARWKLGK